MPSVAGRWSSNVHVVSGDVYGFGVAVMSGVLSGVKVIDVIVAPDVLQPKLYIIRLCVYCKGNFAVAVGAAVFCAVPAGKLITDYNKRSLLRRCKGYV